MDLLFCYSADPQAYLPQQPHFQAKYAQHQQQASQQPLHDQGLPDLVGPHPLEAARRHSSGNLRGSAPDLQGLTGRLTARWVCRLAAGLELTPVPKELVTPVPCPACWLVPCLQLTLKSGGMLCSCSNCLLKIAPACAAVAAPAA